MSRLTILPLLLLLALPLSIHSMSLRYTATQSACVSDSIPEATQQLAALASVQALTCPTTSTRTSTFSASSLGFSGQVVSPWTMANLVALPAFSGNVFTMAVWFQPPTRTIQTTLASFGESFILTTVGASMQIGAGGGASQWTTLPQSGLIPLVPNQVHLIVLSVNVTQAVFSRSLANGSQASTFTTYFPLEASINSPNVVLARTTGWGSVSLTLGSPLLTVLDSRFMDWPVDPSFLFNSTLPPVCPTVASFTVNATENCNFVIDFTNYVLNPGGSSSIVLKSSPLGGSTALLSATSAMYSFNPSIIVHPLIDSFNFSAVSVQCPSPLVATCHIFVKPVDHAPYALDCTAEAFKNQASPVIFLGGDPDGASDVASFTLQSPPVGAFGQLVFCNDTLKLALNASTSASGTGICYLSNFSSPLLDRSSGLVTVGQDVFAFFVSDKEGLRSSTLGQLVVSLVNPGLQSLVLAGHEQNQLIVAVNYTQIMLVSLPLHGTVIAGRQNLSLTSWTTLPVFYQSLGTYFGPDSFQVQWIGLDGFLSPPNLVSVSLNYTYHPSTLSLPGSLNAQFAQQAPLNLTLVNLDEDSYASRVLLSLAQPSGLVIMPSVPVSVTVFQGAACVQVGCATPIELQGPPSLLAVALASAQYMSVAVLDNSINITVWDYSTVFACSAEVSIAVDGGIWGSGDPVQRGNAAIGAAIVGAAVALCCVLARGAWALLPARRDKPRTLIRPPSKTKVLEQASASAALPPPPGLLGLHIEPPPPPPPREEMCLV